MVPAAACTAATIWWPGSSAVSTYLDPAAPVTSTQARPFGLQRSHEYVSAPGLPVHAPAFTVSDWPTVAFPLSDGCRVAASAPVAATMPATDAYAVAVPVESVACTVSPSVAP